MATTNYKNEGFLYINVSTDANAVGANAKPFTMGHIVDTYNNLICPGELPRLLNPDYEDIEDQLFEIKFYTPLLPGIRVRLYWYSDGWELSTINEIYP